MSPSIQAFDRVVVNKAAYDLRLPFTTWSLARFDGPQRGDVIVLDSPTDERLLVKRVVGLPGDMVAVRNGRVVINGREMFVEMTQRGLVEHLGEQVHPVQLTEAGGPDFGPVMVDPNEYFVMGDNRGNSRDGRAFGLVPRQAIRGKVIGVYYRDGLSWFDL
jgi:signal peptidase I